MKNSSIISALIGGTFFAVPYLSLSVGLLPSLAIGVCAYGAGELILHSKEKKGLQEENENLYNILSEAKEQNLKILKMENQVDSPDLKRNIKEINDTVNKIINTIEKKPAKYDKMHNFFNYYLPVTLSILNRYDEIENQRLVTEDGRKFMKQSEDMISKINSAFKNQLSNLYESDMVDTDAEMKVFETMLKADGYDMNEDFKINKEKGENQN